MDIRSFITRPPKKFAAFPPRHAARRRLRLRLSWACNRCWPKLAQAGTDDPLAPKSPMFPARAKRVIFLFMHGGPSSIDTFDPKPYLDANDGKPLPIKQPLTFAAGKTGGLMKSPWKFKNCGQSGLPISDLLPQHPRVRRRSVRGPLHGGRRRGSRRRAAADLHRHLHLHAPQHGLVGALRARHRRTAICPATSPSSRRCRTAARRTGRPASCPAPCRAPPSATPACRSARSRRSPSNTWSIRGSRANSSAMSST